MIETKTQNGPSRWQKNQQRGEFVKYFLSSESEEDSEEEQEKSAPSTRSVQPAAKGGAKLVAKSAPRRNARKIQESEDESE